MNNFSTLESAISVLSDLPRTGWLIRGVEYPESVSDHTFGMLVLAFLVGELTSNGKGSEDCQDTLTMALIHDISEIFFGDLTPRTKKYIPQISSGLSHSEFENSQFVNFLELLPENSRKYLSRIWANFWEKKSTRAEQMHIIDIVEMLSQAYEYEKTGQRKLDEFWNWVPNCRGDNFTF